MSNFSNQVFASPGIRFITDVEQKNEDDIVDLDVRVTSSETDISTLQTDVIILENFYDNLSTTITWTNSGKSFVGNIKLTRYKEMVTLSFTGGSVDFTGTAGVNFVGAIFAIGVLPVEARPSFDQRFAYTESENNSMLDTEPGLLVVKTTGALELYRVRNQNVTWSTISTGSGFRSFSVSYSAL